MSAQRQRRSEGPPQPGKDGLCSNRMRSSTSLRVRFALFARPKIFGFAQISPVSRDFSSQKNSEKRSQVPRPERGCVADQSQPRLPAQRHPSAHDRLSTTPICQLLSPNSFAENHAHRSSQPANSGEFRGCFFYRQLSLVLNHRSSSAGGSAQPVELGIGSFSTPSRYTEAQKMFLNFSGPSPCRAIGTARKFFTVFLQIRKVSLC